MKNYQHIWVLEGLTFYILVLGFQEIYQRLILVVLLEVFLDFLVTLEKSLDEGQSASGEVERVDQNGEASVDLEVVDHVLALVGCESLFEFLELFFSQLMQAELPFALGFRRAVVFLTLEESQQVVDVLLSSQRL